jgi:hypothetical protein
MSRIQSSLALGMAICLSAATSLYAQKPTQTIKSENLAALQLENVDIEAQGIESFFSDLSLEYGIPIGLEIASNDNHFEEFDIELKKGTLADFLNKFVKAYNLYTWDITDGVINIFPKDGYRDLAIGELLKTKVANYKVKENTNCWKAVDLLLATPEIRSELEASGIAQSGLNFSGSYIPHLGREFTLDVSNMTVKSILNKMAKDSSLARIWVVKKYGYEQTFFIRFHALHPDAPVGIENLKKIP